MEFAREGRRRFEASDEAWFGETTAHGEVTSFGTAAEERSRGRDEVLALTIDQVRELNEAAGLDIGKTDEAEDEAEAYEAGDTGWIVTHSRFTFGDGSWAANQVVSVVVRDHKDGGWKSVLTTSPAARAERAAGSGFTSAHAGRDVACRAPDPAVTRRSASAAAT